MDAHARAIEIVTDGLKVAGSRVGLAEEIVIPTHKRNDQGWPTRFVAAQILGGEFDGTQVGVWALGDINGTPAGPIFALDSTAREWSAWGEGAGPGSQMMEVVERLAGYEEAREVRGALRARLGLA